MVPWRELNRRRLATAQCAKGVEKNFRQLAEEELWDSTEKSFQAYEKPLETFTLFSYLGQVIIAGDNSWPEVVGNFSKACKSWARMTMVLGWEGADLRAYRFFFKAVVQAVLIFGLDVWVLTPRIERALVSFRCMITQRVTGRLE